MLTTVQHLIDGVLRQSGPLGTIVTQVTLANATSTYTGIDAMRLEATAQQLGLDPFAQIDRVYLISPLLLTEKGVVGVPTPRDTITDSDGTFEIIGPVRTAVAQSFYQLPCKQVG
jgi:hypothetical protein